MTKKLNKTGRNYSTKVTIGYALACRLVWAYTRDIEESLSQVKAIKNLNQIIKKSPVLTGIALHPLHENLSVLERLIECYLAGNDGKTRETGFTIGDGHLYDLLQEIYKFVKEFPPKLEAFYQNYSAYKKRALANSPVCEICKKRGANHFFSNIKVHDKCLIGVDSKYCKYCGHLYLGGEQNCSNKPECSKHQLKETKATNGPHGSISMQITEEEIGKIEGEIKQKSSHYKEGE